MLIGMSYECGNCGISLHKASSSLCHVNAQTIHYVTAAARQALEAAQPSALAGGKEYNKSAQDKTSVSSVTCEELGASAPPSDVPRF